MTSKIALVTGANSGIGYATARALAAAPENYHVVVTGRSLQKAQTAAADIKASLGRDDVALTALELDVTSQPSIDAAAAAVKDKFGRLDVLVNNAGIQSLHPDLATSFRDTLATNTIGPALVSAAFRPLLLAAPAPWHLYVGSITSSLTQLTDSESWMRTTDAGTVAYRASKAALNMVAMHEQLETQESALQVRVLCPGFVVSNLRGTSEEARTGGGRAGDPDNSARLVLSILRGERDADADKLIEQKGVSPW
jgi:NAD(P)-dependent dehydrogenase (short-subunit alcohol dehydrogenase family)